MNSTAGTGLVGVGALAPQIYSPTITNHNFVVRVAGAPGYNYSIESTDALSPANWRIITNFIAPATDQGPGTGVFEFMEAIGTTGSGFYRSRLIFPGPTPLPQAHAHNDYEHPRPLLDALDNGFCSVEADVWLVNDQLLVAHDLPDARPERTLQALYLDPLRARVAKNGGKVFQDGPPFTLLVDVKSDATDTYLALRQALLSYANMLTKFSLGSTDVNAVTVIVSGNRARSLMAAETERFAAYDGRLTDLDSGDSRHFIPLISDNWSALSDAERANLADLVTRAHIQGRRLRFWATPDSISMWTELRNAGVDLINTDNLIGLREFLLSQQPAR